ncbi:MAG: hypothetical protein H7Z38_10585 [Rubrivivax sp.]|nr:hypothetical protein [Pyrinomonadaceae bacterium]
MRAFILSLTLLLCFSSDAARTTTRQDNERRFLDTKLVPAEGVVVSDFVPKGWKVETDEGEVTGDLNKDGAPDKVLRLVEDMPIEGADGTYNTRYRALVILFARPGGVGFARAAVATKLLGCTLCAGMLGDPYGGNVVIEIKKGVLDVNQLSGAREASELAQHFRYDAALKRFVLIGEDTEYYDRLTLAGTQMSTNYLTGVRITKKTKSVGEGKDPAIVSNKTTRVPIKSRFIEDVDYERQ